MPELDAATKPTSAPVSLPGPPWVPKPSAPKKVLCIPTRSHPLWSHAVAANKSAIHSPRLHDRNQCNSLMPFRHLVSRSRIPRFPLLVESPCSENSLQPLAQGLANNLPATSPTGPPRFH